MALVFRQMGVYLKTLVGVVVLVVVVLFFAADKGNLSEIWLFGQRKGAQAVATNWVVFVSLVTGLLLWWLARWMVTLPGQWRTLRQDARRQDLPPEQDVGGK
jgi:uncharacterized membrane-anchored protein